MKSRMVNFRGQTSMNSKESKQPDVHGRWLAIEEVRLIADLRVMHAKINELFHMVTTLQERYDETEIVRYADQELLTRETEQMDQMYLWFVKLKQEQQRRKKA